MVGLTPLGSVQEKNGSTATMKIKQGASLNGLKIVMRKALITAEATYNYYNKDLIITSGTDGEHSAGSLHYYGYAIDIRTRHLTQSEERDIYTEIKDCLQWQGFTVVLEKTHIHIEFTQILAGAQ